MRERIIAEIANSLGRDGVKSDDKLIDLADSLEVAQLVLDLEEEFSTEITDDDLKKLFTVKDVIDYIDTGSAGV